MVFWGKVSIFFVCKSFNLRDIYGEVSYIFGIFKVVKGIRVVWVNYMFEGFGLVKVLLFLEEKYIVGYGNIIDGFVVGGVWEWDGFIVGEVKGIVFFFFVSWGIGYFCDDVGGVFVGVLYMGYVRVVVFIY